MTILSVPTSFGSGSHVQTLIIGKLGVDQNHYTFTLILLIKIVLCSRFPRTKFIFIYTKVYWVIYDSGSVHRGAIFSPRETSPTNPECIMNYKGFDMRSQVNAIQDAAAGVERDAPLSHPRRRTRHGDECGVLRLRPGFQGRLVRRVRS